MNAYMRPYLIGLCFGLLLLFHNSAIAWDSGLEIENPRRMDVVIEGTDEGGQKNGLSADLIRAKVELYLRRNNIIPNAKPEYKDGYLYVNINIVGKAFSCTVEFKRKVNYVVKGRTYEILATVWSDSGTGTHGSDTSFIFQHLSDGLDMFVNEYLKANLNESNEVSP